MLQETGRKYLTNIQGHQSMDVSYSGKGGSYLIPTFTTPIIEMRRIHGNIFEFI